MNSVVVKISSFKVQTSIIDDVDALTSQPHSLDNLHLKKSSETGTHVHTRLIFSEDSLLLTCINALYIRDETHWGTKMPSLIPTSPQYELGNP